MTSDDATLRPVLALESGPGRRRRRRARDGAAARHRERDRVRHGRHDGEGLADRERRRLARPRVRGRRLALGRQPADARRRRAAADPDDRHRRGRRRRRQHRLARPGRRAAGRARAAPAPRRARPATAAAAIEPTVTDANVVLGYIPAGPRRRRADHDLARARRGGARARSPSRSGSRSLEAAAGIHAHRERAHDARAAVGLVGEGPRPARVRADRLRRLRARPRRRARRGARRARRCSCRRSRGSSASLGLLFARPEFHDVHSCHLDVRRGRPGRARRRSSTSCEARLAPSLDGATRRVGAERRAPLRRPELGDRGRACRRAASTRSARRRCSRASRTSTSVLYGVRGEPGSPIEIRALRLGGARPVGRRRPRFDARRRRSCPTATRRARRGFGGDRSETSRSARARRSASEPEPGPLLVDEYDTTVVVRRGLDRPARPRDRRRSCSSGRSRVTRRARRIRPGHAADRRQRARVDRRRDGDDDLPHRALDRRPRRDGLLGRALRRRAARRSRRPSRVPFHLGSIPTAMDSLLAQVGRPLRPGDVFVMNDPFDGGIHLQDIFVVKPVFLDETLIGFAVDDRPPRRRRRPAARLERLRQHRDLPGGPPPALAAALRPRASRSRRSSS